MVTEADWTCVNERSSALVTHSGATSLSIRCQNEWFVIVMELYTSLPLKRNSQAHIKKTLIITYCLHIFSLSEGRDFR